MFSLDSVEMAFVALGFLLLLGLVFVCKPLFEGCGAEPMMGCHTHKQSGELVVSGQNEVTLLLTAEPKNIRVLFIDEEVCNPCNIQENDAVSFNIKHCGHGKHKHYELIINWTVQNVRKIEWSITF